VGLDVVKLTAGCCEFTGSRSGDSELGCGLRVASKSPDGDESERYEIPEVFMGKKKPKIFVPPQNVEKCVVHPKRRAAMRFEGVPRCSGCITDLTPGDQKKVSPL
jgi:hypothetical protein